MRFKSVVFLSLFCLLPFLAQAADKQPPAATSPESLPKAIQNGTQETSKSIDELNKQIAEAQGGAEKAQNGLQVIKVESASLKSFLAVQSLNLPQIDNLLRKYALVRTDADSLITKLNQQVDQLGKKLSHRQSALDSLKQQAGYIKEQEPEAWKGQIRDSYDNYTPIAQSELDLLNKLLGLQQQTLESLREQSAIADGLQKTLKDLQDVQRVEFLKRQQQIPIWSRVETGVMELLSQPQIVSQWFFGKLQSGEAWGFMRDGVIPLVGLFLLLAFLLWVWLRLRRAAIPVLQRAERGANPHNRKFLRFLIIMVHQLFSIAFVLWFLLFMRVLDLGQSRPALILLSVIAAAVVQRIWLSLIEGTFSTLGGEGFLALPPETAAWYRLRTRIFSFCVSIGIIGFIIAGQIGAHSTTIFLFWHIYCLLILALTVWLTNPPHSILLVAELPLPKWLTSIWALKIFRTVLIAIIAAMIFSALFQFMTLSYYIATTAVGVGGVILGFLLAMLAGRELVHVFLHPEHGLLRPTSPQRTRLLLRLSSLIEGIGSIVLIIGLLTSVLLVLGFSINILKVCAEALTWKLSLGTFKFSLLNILMAGLVLYIVKWSARLSKTLLQLHLFPRMLWDPGIQYTVSSILQYVIFIVGAILVLNVIGIPMTNLVVVAGALGLGIGLGLQNLVSNFVSGLVLLIERPIRVGDMLVVDGQWGEVKEIRIRTTVFQTFDRCVIIIPNTDLTSSKITNWTHYGKGVNRLSLKVGVAYGTDIKLVTSALTEACVANSRVLDSPPPQIYFEAYGESSLDFHILVFLRTPDDRTPATHELNTAIFETLQKNGIEIPFPQRDLYVKNWPESGESQAKGEKPMPEARVVLNDGHVRQDPEPASNTERASGAGEGERNVHTADTSPYGNSEVGSGTNTGLVRGLKYLARWLQKSR